ncbi:MAG: hypothetical protein WC745_05195 [Patescibacteria group bacterium]|jgi:hypothetical protein
MEEKKKKLISFLVAICFSFSISASVFISPLISLKARAQSIGLEGAQSELAGVAAGMGITVIDPGVTAGVESTFLETATGWLMDRARENWRDMLFNASAMAFKSGLRFFLNELAYNSAVYLATGDKGQTPMFYTDSWKDYLLMAVDGAAGMFLDKMVTNIGSATGWWQNFSICDPNINVKIMIALGLRRQMYERPRCTFSQLTENWESKLSSPTFLNDFQNMFNPWESDMGIALTMQAGSVDYAQKAKESATYQRLSNDFKPITEKISGFIKSPSRATMKAFDKPIDDSDAPEKIFTGSMAADAIDIFISTLIGKLFEQWLMSGLVSEVPSIPDLDMPEIESLNEGIEAAKERFRNLKEPQFGTRGDYDILVELASCPDPSKPGPSDCVITEKFRQAVANRLTLKSAMDQGYLNKNGVFGFVAGKSLEPKYENEDYPYRSLVILRKYRIIPVGWEIGAQYIKMNCPQCDNDKGKNITLKEMAECFEADDGLEGYEESWCRGLVDPNWVLKAPLNYCKKLGYGSEITSKSVSGEGVASKVNITRADDYCADEQSCVKENFDGSCQVYGYCSEERRTWNFNNRSCDPRFNTCETFRSRSGNTASYLENTLDYNGCTADNVGCLGYCKTENYVPSVKNTTFIIEQDYEIEGGKIRTRKWELPATFQNSQTAEEFYGYNSPKSLMENQWVVKADRTEFFIHYNTVTGKTSIGWLHDKPQLVKCQAYIKHPDDPNDAQSENDWCVDGANPGACGNGENWQYSDPSGNCFEYEDQNSDGQYYCDKKISGRMEDRLDDVNCDGGEVSLGFSKVQANGNRIVVKDDGGDANNSGIGNVIKEGDKWTEAWSKRNTDGGVIEMPSGNWGVEITPTLTMGVNKLIFAYEGGSLDESQEFFGDKPFRIKSSPDTLSGEWQCKGADDKIYFDKDAEECDSGNEGCHEFIRTKAGTGANLLINSGFEDYLDIGGWDGWGKVDSDRRSGNSALKLMDYDQNNPLSKSIAVGSREAGEYFTFSLYAKNCAGLKAGLGDAENETGLSDSSDWQRLTLSAKIEGSGDKVKIGLKEYTAGCVIDDIKLERGAAATDYGSYGGAGKIYEKLIPAYLENSAENKKNSYCYVDAYTDATDAKTDYSLKEDALPECSSFARKCNPDEANCELYTSVRTKEAIPAKISADDSCPASCVGYDMFIQKETGFDSARDEYFIPKTAKTCGYVSAGCDEFTNLDELEKGAEKREYYSELRQCVKPEEAGSPGCNDFYTWEGSSETGFQLKVFKLKQDENDSETGDDWDADPAVTGNDSAKCSEEIYNIEDMNDARFNSDCRQFYNRQGGISYHLYLKTISCSDNCHPYRRTENNVDASITSEGDCSGADKHWDAGSKECVSCKGGGVWRNDHNACVYQAIPGEGRACSAGAAGCREYNGNNGANVRTVFTDNFEDGTGGWTANGKKPALSGEAVFVGQHSIEITGEDASIGLSKTVGTMLADNDESSYVLTFTAKKLKGGAGGSWIAGNGIYLSNQTDNPSYFEIDEETKAGLAGDGDWLLYKFNLEKLNHAETDDEILVIKASQGFYIDNIKLTQTIDRYYLIKNSWNTPLACDNKIDDPEGRKAYASGSAGCKAALPDSDGTVRACFPEEMLNCDQYKDREKIDYYLKSFSALCQDSAVGCELMVDTHNSANPEAASYENGEVSVPADNFIYAVYDKKKICNAADKGCERLGKPYSYSGESVYQNEFLKNNPDVYPKILCSSSEDGCEEWVSSESEKNYFKDPGDQVCEYRQALGLGAGWWKKQVKRCDDGSGTGSSVNGKIDAMIDAENNPVRALENQICVDTGGCGRTGIKCDSDEVCGAYRTCFEGECRYTCVADTNNYACPTDAGKSPKTIGYPGVPIEQPDKEDIRDINDSDGDGDKDEIIKTIKWAGACPASEAGCSEYIDPVSRFSANAIFNADFSQDVDANGWDGWNCAGSNCSQELQLSPDALYIISGKNLAGGNVSLTEKTAAAKDIHELIEGAGEKGVNYLKDGENLIALDLPGDIRGSKRFYMSGNDITNGTLSVKGKADNSMLELKEAVISYQLKKNVNKTSCNGLVNFDDGCVLFNERTYSGSGWTGLIMNADSSKDGETPKINPPANANALIKVTPDRVCNEWLACRSAVGLGIKNANGAEEQACFDIGACRRMDESGKCVSFSISDDEKAMEAKGVKGASSNVSEFANRSGYSKAGLKGVDDPGMRGYLPFGLMEQAGEVASVPNGNFEIYGANKYPYGWLPYNDSAWNENLFSVINNPYAAQQEGGNSGKGGIGYPVEGISFLKYSSEGTATSALSELIEVEAGKDYYLSYRVNTEDLKSKDGINDVKAAITIEGNGGNEIITSESDKGQGWQVKVKKFNSGTNRNIGLHLNSEACDDKGKNCVKCKSPGNCLGNIYIDDIKIMPALEVRNDWNTIQSCRLYPQSDSLSCDYFNDSGLREKGLLGYCLQYDRSPGSPENCLQWWPIDKVKGDGIEEGAGYRDRFPLYYCTDGVYTKKTDCAKSDVLPINEHCYEEGCGDPDCKVYGDLPGADDSLDKAGFDFGKEKLTVDTLIWAKWKGYDAQSSDPKCSTEATDIDMKKLSQDPKSREVFNKKFSGIASNYNYYYGGYWDTGDENGPAYTAGFLFFYESDMASHKKGDLRGVATCAVDCNCVAMATWDTSFSINYLVLTDSISCNKLVQVVTSMGQNKYWSSRVYKGSSYRFPCNDDIVGLGKTSPYYKLIITPENQRCSYLSDYPPFGSLVYPYPSANPYEWDGKGDLGIQPLYYELPDTESYSAPYQPRAGQISTKENVQRLFAKSYGIWRWDGYKCDNNLSKECVTDDCPGGSCGVDKKCDAGANAGKACVTDDCPGGSCSLGGRYLKVTSKCSNDYNKDCGNNADCPGGECILNWNPPARICNGNPSVRPEYSAAAPNADLCGIPPKIGNISVNGKIGVNETIGRSGFINLAFTSKLDAQQLPMTMIAVDWGDYENTIITGVEMRDRQSTSTPHSLYHLYDYWDIKRKAADTNPRGQDVSDIDCPANENYCRVRPRIKIMDNWGWCSEGTNDTTAATDGPCSFNYQCAGSGESCNQNFDCAGTSGSKWCRDGYYEFGNWVVVRER